MASGLYKFGLSTPIKHRLLVYIQEKNFKAKLAIYQRGKLVGITHLTFKLLRLAKLFRAGNWIDLINFPILAASDSHKRALYAGCRETEQAVARFSTFQQRQAQDSHICPGWNPRPQIFACVQFKSRREPGWTAKDVTVAIGGHSESITFLAFDDCDIFQTDHKRRLRDCFLDNIGRCKGPSRLDIPLFYEASLLDDCKALLKSLPNLVALVILDYPQGPAHNKGAASRFANCFEMSRIQTSSKLIFLAINFNNRQGVPLDCDESVSRCFVRRGREGLFGGS